MRDMDTAPLVVCLDPEDYAFAAAKIDPDRALVGRVEDIGTMRHGCTILVIARGDGYRALGEFGLLDDGLLVDLGKNGSLASFLEGVDDPTQTLLSRSGDAFAAEERPFAQWEFPEPVQGVSSGIEFLDHHLRWTDQGELVVVAGPYGCGKSTVTRMLAMAWADHVGREHGQSASLCGWEDRGEIVKREVSRYALGGDFEPNQMNDRQWDRLADMHNRVRWTVRIEGEERLLEWYVALVEHRVRHHNVRFFVFDPWNEHDSHKDIRQTETEYVRDVMQVLQALARRLKIIIVIVTHVGAKMYDENGGVKPFRIANAAGSAAFGAKATRGICMLRTTALGDYSDTGQQDHTVLYFDKTKNEETMGKRGPIACLFDPKRMSLVQDIGATMQVRTIWR